jgi:hypothetical protein
MKPLKEGAVTVTEPEVTVSENGTTTPAPEVQDGIDYLPSGKAVFTIDGKPYTLRLPKFGEFRALHTAWTEGTGLAPKDQLAHQVDWVSNLFSMLSDHPLPEGEDAWPAWLGVGAYQAKLMIHFRDVPLARGGGGVG